MATFPRTKPPRISTPPQFPPGFESWGLSGKGQFRSFYNVGRVWQEVWPAMDLHSADIRALIEAINEGLRNKTIWDVQHVHYKQNYGVCSGSPQVDGSGQTGSSIDVDGVGSVSNWLRKGDIIQFAYDTVVYDVTANVNSSGGDATIPINPPIFPGNSPPDNNAVTVNAANIYFKAVIVGVQMPDIEADGIILPGLTVMWRETPT